MLNIKSVACDKENNPVSRSGLAFTDMLLILSFIIKICAKGTKKKIVNKRRHGSFFSIDFFIHGLSCRRR